MLLNCLTNFQPRNCFFNLSMNVVKLYNFFIYIRQVKSERNQTLELEGDLFSCPICYEPLIRKGPTGLTLYVSKLIFNIFFIFFLIYNLKTLLVLFWFLFSPINFFFIRKKKNCEYAFGIRSKYSFWVSSLQLFWYDFMKISKRLHFSLFSIFILSIVSKVIIHIWIAEMCSLWHLYSSFSSDYMVNLQGSNL